MKKLKISIRVQLTILVCLVSILSLVILAIVTGVYFSKNMGDLRAERLEVVAQLKATQLQQSFSYLYYQVYWLSSRDTITSSLSSFKAGNTSFQIWDTPASTISQFLDSSEIFTNARLYDLQFNNVIEEDSDIFMNNGLSNQTLDVLFPLRANVTDSRSILREGGYIVSPILNDTTYFMSMTFPIYGNNSFLISKPDLSGYLTVAMNAESLRSVSNDSSAIKNGQISIARPVHNVSSNYDNYTNVSTLVGFEYVFPPGSSVDYDVTLKVFDIDSYSVMKDVFYHNSTGYSTSIRNPFNDHVSVGYSIASMTFTSWAVIVEQSRSTFVAPVYKLRNIIIGVVIGICVLLCILTFPIAYWFVRPITKLIAATEIITKGRKTDKDDCTASSQYCHIEKLNNSHSNELQQSYNNNSNANGAASGFTAGFNRFSLNSSSIHSTFRIPPRISQHNRFFNDELTELTETFNIMTDELERQYTHLEDRVKSRTKELEASKVQAESANEAKTVFIANISHELRTPLNGILGMTAIAMAEQDPFKIQDSLKLIHRSGELLLHILTELLTYSKNTLKRSKLEKSNFQILEITNQVRSIFTKLVKDRKVNFQILIKPDFMRKMILFGDAYRIIQVVMNLASNSLKFTPIDGRVDISFKVLGEYDLKKSQKHKFKKVFVLDKNSQIKESLKSESDATYGNDDFEVINEKDEIRENSAHGPEDENNDINNEVVNSDDDVKSLRTLSTTEYNNTIFNSQFEKPLPLPPTDHPTISINPVNETLPSTLPNDKRNSKLSISGSMSDDLEIENNNKIYQTVPLRHKKTWVIEISVTDTGPGIEPALQEKVFEPFVQGDQTLSRSYGGTGLGLSICRQLAGMMNGTLTLESNLGVGSKFIFTLPLTQTREILVDDETQFYNDEFNIKSKKNMSTIIDDDSDKCNSDDDTGETSSKNDIKSEPSSVGNGKDHRRNGSVSELSLNTEKFEKSSLKLARESLQRSFSNGSKRKLHLKLDGRITDPPHLFTNSSTGTANSDKEYKRESKNVFNTKVQLKILVAEDNSVNQEVIKRMLRLEGFTDVKLACDGHEAVEYVKESIEKETFFDIIFMDVQMPKIDGLSATKMIRNLHQETPIVALTAFADESNAKECLQNGMNGFLPKPIKRTQLRKIITEFCPIVLGEMVITPSEEKNFKNGIV